MAEPNGKEGVQELLQKGIENNYVNVPGPEKVDDILSNQHNSTFQTMSLKELLLTMNICHICNPYNIDANNHSSWNNLQVCPPNLTKPIPWI